MVVLAFSIQLTAIVSIVLVASDHGPWHHGGEMTTSLPSLSVQRLLQASFQHSVIQKPRKQRILTELEDNTGNQEDRCDIDQVTMYEVELSTS